jgi:pimeloyl-ACP methyl ester carboxylesterase
MRLGILSFLLTVISRMLLRRDRLSGGMKRARGTFTFDEERIVIPSGDRRLSAVNVSAGDDTPAILICHGIGELVEYWGRVQGVLKEMGVSSLVFNYSGYGASSGRVSAANCEEDAIAAHRYLKDHGHRSSVLLGFSLGSGIGCAAASRIDVDGLILCEGFSTFREGAMAIGCARWLTHAVPDVWNTAGRVCDLSVPVLVVHSDTDELFPMTMAKRVAEACGTRGELMVVNGLSHDAPIYTATPIYWQPIADWVKRRSVESGKEKSLAERNQSALSGSSGDVESLPAPTS